jgi:hypothetical protein
LCEQAATSTSEAQGRHREVRSGGSVERNREPTNRNRIQAWWVRASGRETAKPWRPRSHCVDPAVVRERSRSLTWGDLALCLKGDAEKRSEKSAEVVVASRRGQGLESRVGEGPNGRESGTTMSLDGALCQTSAHAELSPARRGEAPRPRAVVRRYRRLRTRSAREGRLG